MAIDPQRVIPVYMLSAEQQEDVIQFLHDMPIPEADKRHAYEWWTRQVGLQVRDDDLRRLTT